MLCIILVLSCRLYFITYAVHIVPFVSYITARQSKKIYFSSITEINFFNHIKCKHLIKRWKTFKKRRHERYHLHNHVQSKLKDHKRFYNLLLSITQITDCLPVDGSQDGYCIANRNTQYRVFRKERVNDQVSTQQCWLGAYNDTFMEHIWINCLDLGEDGRSSKQRNTVDQAN